MLIFIYRYKATITYIVILFMLSILFDLLSGELFSSDFSPFSGFVGAMLVLRNFSQREIGHWVLILMLFAGLLIHFLVDIEYPSSIAFLSGEISDMIIFGALRKTIIQRMFWSVVISAFVDSVLFLYLSHHFSWFSLMLLSSTKITIALGILLIWDFLGPFQRGFEQQYKLRGKNSNSKL